jgi:tetratricopeptide (TPR) repeat protein
MSAVWTWLVSNVSGLPLDSDTLRLTVGAGMLLGGLALLWAFLARRRRGHRRARQTVAPARGEAPATTAPAVAVAPAVRAAAPEQPAATPLPAPSIPSAGVYRERGERRVSSQPLGAAHGATLAATTAPAPARAVAVAERPADPLLASAGTETWMPPTTAPHDTPAADAEARARALYRRGLQLLASAEANRVQALHEALDCFRRAQEIWTRERAPERWAAIENDIGRVYQEMPDGDRVAHVRAAIAHHHAALDVFDPVSHSINWAWTQSALGAAYQCLPTGSALANARAAIAYHQRALDILTRENAPLAWAWNQNNLAAAYEMMRGGADGEWAAHLRDAAECYAAALEVYTAEAQPVQHQVIARNLARVRSELATLE